jgi:hypothetical protein
MLTIGSGRGRASFHKRRWFQIIAATLVCEERYRELVLPPIGHRGRWGHHARRAGSRCPCKSEHQLHESRQSRAPVLGRACQLRTIARLADARACGVTTRAALELIQYERRSLRRRGLHDTRSQAFARRNPPLCETVQFSVVGAVNRMAVFPAVHIWVHDANCS